MGSDTPPYLLRYSGREKPEVAFAEWILQNRRFFTIFRWLSALLLQHKSLAYTPFKLNSVDGYSGNAALLLVQVRLPYGKACFPRIPFSIAQLVRLQPIFSNQTT